jgi:hypothetical protein
MSFEIFSPDSRSSIKIGEGNHCNVKMINTKDDHVELYNIVEKELSNKEIEELQSKLINDGVYHCIQGNLKVLITDKVKYINKDYEFDDDLYSDFLKQLDHCKLKDGMINDFVNNGYSQNGCIIYQNWMSNYFDEIDETYYSPNLKSILYDHKNSYAQHKQCDYYIGFPTVFIDFCSGDFDIEFIKKNIGYYMISDVDISKCNNNVIKHLEKLKIFNHDIFTSVELTYYYDIGVRFNCRVGTFCREKIDLSFTDEMIKTKSYCNFIGKLAQRKYYYEYKVFTSLEHAEKLQSDFNGEYSMFKNKNI